MDPLRHPPDDMEPEDLREAEGTSPDEESRNPEPAAGADDSEELVVLDDAYASDEEGPGELFVMEPDGDDLVLASAEGTGSRSGASGGKAAGAKPQDPEWLLRGGEEVLAANAEPADLAPPTPDEVAELEGVAAVGATASHTRVRRVFRYGSMAAAALLLLTLGVVTLRGGWSRGSRDAEKTVEVARAPEPRPEPPTPAPVEPTPVPPPVESEPEPPAPPPVEDGPRTPPVPVDPTPEPEPPQAPTPTVDAGPVSVQTPGGEFVLLKAGEVLLTLRNGNYFTGKIYRLSSDEITLRVPGGEIVFGMRTLAKVIPLASAGKGDELGHLPDGYVELANGNRIWGKILEDTPDYAVIAFASAKITIPRAAVRSVVQSAPTSVGIAE